MKTISSFELKKIYSNETENVEIFQTTNGYAVCYKYISMKKEKVTLYGSYKEAMYEYTKILLFLLS